MAASELFRCTKGGVAFVFIHPRETNVALLLFGPTDGGVASGNHAYLEEVWPRCLSARQTWRILLLLCAVGSHDNTVKNALPCLSRKERSTSSDLVREMLEPGGRKVRFYSPQSSSTGSQVTVSTMSSPGRESGSPERANATTSVTGEYETRHPYL